MKQFQFSSASEPEGATPKNKVEFEINGVVIHCVDELDGLTLLEFAQTAGAMATGLDPSAEMDAKTMAALASGAGSLLEVLQTVIIDADWEAFRKVVKAPGSKVGPEQIAEIAAWLVERYTNDTPTD